MKKAIFLLIIVLALVIVGTVAAGGKAKAGANQYPFHLSGAVCPLPWGTIDVPGSSGKVVVNQPNGEVSVVMTVIANGLLPNTDYIVYIRNFNNPGRGSWEDIGCGGPWTNLATVQTDMYGHLDWHMNLWAGELSLGTHNMSVWLNDAGIGLTVLISNSFPIVIE